MRKVTPTRSWQGVKGFSLLELMIVAAIFVILAAVSIPKFLTAYYDVRLKSSAANLSGLMQRARMQAARQNTTYQILYTTDSSSEVQAYIDLNGNGALDAGPPTNEPVVTFVPNITMATAAPTGSGGQPTPYVLVGDTAGTTYNNSTTLAYSPRGLPCAYIAGVCATPAAGYFVYYINDNRPGYTAWAAVVVSRSGRTKSVIWNGSTWQ